MNVQEKTIAALAPLFSTPPYPNTDTPVEQLRENADKRDTTEEGIRRNGIIERDYQTSGFHLDIQCTHDQLVEINRRLFDLDYFLETITGIDWIRENQLEAVYDYSRYDFDLCRVVVRVRVDRDKPHLPTITPIYTGAAWHEREAHDFFGIIFDDHPNLIPLLLPEDADFHPLLKDFKA
ncbi:MAG: NADH-quinone oxidoreductase subunit C [Desulfobacterales bacterium]|nr:MAG: NADH-quinone oxidoreductase subunit C [Desulfobacterales bacterium]